MCATQKRALMRGGAPRRGHAGALAAQLPGGRPGANLLLQILPRGERHGPALLALGPGDRPSSTSLLAQPTETLRLAQLLRCYVLEANAIS